jgi:glycerol kinase
MIKSAAETKALARSVPDNEGVYFVPALVGLGAPHWDPYARGLLIGITRGTTQGHIARAVLESMAYQTRDVIEAMQRDSGIALKELRCDGGASVNSVLMQFQSDILGVPVEVPSIVETTALGAAYLAGLATGFWNSREELAQKWQLENRYTPRIDEASVSACSGVGTRRLSAVKVGLWTTSNRSLLFRCRRGGAYLDLSHSAGRERIGLPRRMRSSLETT